MPSQGSPPTHSQLPGVKKNSWFANVLLHTKLRLVMGVCLLLLAGLTAAALWAFWSASGQNRRLASRTIPLLENLITIERESYEAMLHLTAYALSGDNAEYSGGRQNLARVKEAEHRLRELMQSSAGQAAGEPPAAGAPEAALRREIERFDDRAEETRDFVLEQAQAGADLHNAITALETALMRREFTGPAASSPFLNQSRKAFSELSPALVQALAGKDTGAPADLAPAFVTLERLAIRIPGQGEELADLAHKAGNALQRLARGGETALRLSRERQETASAVVALSRTMASRYLKDIQNETEQSGALFSTMLVALPGFFCLALGLGLCMLRLLRKTVVQPLEFSLCFAEQAFDGNDQVTLDLVRNDELGRLAALLRKAVGAHREAEGRILRADNAARQKIKEAGDLAEEARKALEVLRQREEAVNDKMAALIKISPPQRHAAHVADDSKTAGLSARSPQREQEINEDAPEAEKSPAPPLTPGLSSQQPELDAEAGPDDRDSVSLPKQARPSRQAVRSLTEIAAGMRDLTRLLNEK